MRRTIQPIALPVLTLLLLGPALLPGCGGSDICLGCDSPSADPTPSPENSVTLQGDVYTVIPDTLLDKLVVLACTDYVEGTNARDCGGRTGQPTNEGDFFISKVAQGSIDVFFYLREEPDRIAQLQDPDDKLGNITQGYTVDLQSISVYLDTGIADALRIEVESSPSPTSTPTPEPDVEEFSSR